MENQVFEKIKQFVYRQRWKYKKELRRETTLEGDLGITGDDAVEFMEAFSEEFDVDVSNLDLRKYFDGEGFGLIDLSRLFRKKDPPKSAKPMTLGDLERAVIAGEWTEPIV